MHNSLSNSPASASRRFLLLPEESTMGGGERPRVRRYRLASISRRSAGGTDIASARLSGDLGRLGLMRK